MDKRFLRALAAFVAAVVSVLMIMPAGMARAQDYGGDDYDEAEIVASYAWVSYLTGDVLIDTPDTDEWSALSPNYPLRAGDRLWIGDDSKLEVRFEDGEKMWINYQTSMDIVDTEKSRRGNTYQMALTYGEASFSVDNFETLGSVFQVDTPNASVRAFGRAEFRVTTLSDGTTQVGVKNGTVEVESEEGIANVHSDEMLEVYADGRSRIMDLPAFDDWDDWVDSRTDRYKRTYASSRYLPREMHSYADEFDDGRWVSYPDYGYVWVPRVTVVDWSPYSNGRWVWVRGDYVWLSYDPWYAPFHYGRWHWGPTYGWCWIPPAPRAVYWGPGFVGWVTGPDYVYWVPLAPREVYYGRGYYGPHSVNIRKTKIVNVTNIYINSKVKNSVVVVDRDDFVKGKTRRVKIVDKENPFRHKGARNTKLIAAAPVEEIKPARETKLARPDVKVSERNLPPEKIKKRAEFVSKRKVAKSPEKSAFSENKRPKLMKGLERMKEPAWKKDGRKKERVQSETVTKPSRGKERVREPAREKVDTRERVKEREKPARKMERLDERGADKPTQKRETIAPEKGARGERGKGPEDMKKAAPRQEKPSKKEKKADRPDKKDGKEMRQQEGQPGPVDFRGTGGKEGYF